MSDLAPLLYRARWLQFSLSGEVRSRRKRVGFDGHDELSGSLLAAPGGRYRTDLDGVPRNPGAWLTTTSRNRALDRLRRRTTEAAKLRETAVLARGGEPPAVSDESGIGDDQLRLLGGVLAVVHLLFNEGYAATAGTDRIRQGLCAEAIRLARLLAALLPDEPEALGLLALLLFQNARRAARIDAAGDLVLLQDQDRTQ